MSSGTEPRRYPPVGPIDAELAPVLAAAELISLPFLPTHLAAVREGDAAVPDFRALTSGRPVTVSELVVPASPSVAVSVLRPADASPRAPALVFAHGGGLMFGTRFFEGGALVDLVEAHSLVVIAVEYRLAPEDPYPSALDDCMAVVGWLRRHSPEVGIDPDRILVGGRSAGGSSAAAVGLRCRDEGIPLAGQLLIYPMLDDRTVPDGRTGEDAFPVWNHGSNATGWEAYRGTAPYGVPARATSFGGMAPLYLEVGSADLFRDEGVRYAQEVWAAGGEAELHVWAGAFHGSDHLAPEVTVGRGTHAARANWIERVTRR